MRSSIGPAANVFITAERRCLVCDFVEDVRELETTDAIGSPCSRCRAPSERTAILARHLADPNPHAAALGRLGGLKGGPARAASLSARRRRRDRPRRRPGALGFGNTGSRQGSTEDANERSEGEPRERPPSQPVD